MWIDFLRASPTPARDLMRDPGSLATTEPVILEVRSGLAGFRLIRLDQALTSLTLLGVDPAVDFHTGSELYRAGKDFEVISSVAPELKTMSAL